MSGSTLRIWTNLRFASEVRESLDASLSPHRLMPSAAAVDSNLIPAESEPLARQVEVLFGQPHPDDILNNPALKFVQLSTAGYTRYDNDAMRAYLRSRSIPMCNASSVYDEPCAQHALAMILAAARRLPRCVLEQRDQTWNIASIRRESRLLCGQTLLLVGYGAIARRLAELLMPLRMKLLAFRRSVRGDENVKTLGIEQLDAHLPGADHVVNILPSSPQTRLFFDADRLGRLKRGVVFYNLGRGDTVDQDALASGLHDRRIDAAFLDVTTPEPLPPGHPLWTAPGCTITPHTAGGHVDEQSRLGSYFADNFARFVAGQPLLDRIV